MLVWLKQYLATILICLALAAIVIAIIVSMVRAKKKRNTSCSGGCQCCPMSGSCHGH